MSNTWSPCRATRRKLVFTAAGAFAAWPGAGPAQPAAAQADAFIAMTRRPLIRAQGDADVRRRVDVVVGARPDGSALLADLYLPRLPTVARPPWALLVHGGLPDGVPVLPRQWQVFKDWGALLAQRGVAAVMFEHRLGSPRRRLDEAMDAVAQVAHWLRISADAPPLRAAPGGAIVFSAGGLMVPEMIRRRAELALDRVAMYYPLTGMDADSNHDEATVRRMSLSDAMPLAAEQGVMLQIVRAGADQVPGLLPRLDRTVAAALAANVRLELINLPRAPHGLDSIAGSAGAPEAIDRTVAFCAAATG